MSFGKEIGYSDINTEKNIIDYKKPLDYKRMMKYINIFSERYPFMSVSSLGESIMGRSIPLITLGNGEKALLYVGAHHGMEWITSIMLMRYINEYCDLMGKKSRIYNYTLNYIFNSRTIYIVPMLNPDGVDYQINGVSEDNILRERLIRMNGGSTDFSSWQANARGVDLNHNYNSGFDEYKQIERDILGICDGAPTKFSGTAPHSEPETGALCNFIKFNDNIRMLITLHSQGEEIYYTSAGKTTPRSKSIAGAFSRMTGYTLSEPEGTAAYGGLLDWCINELNLPAFTVECGKGTNPLPLNGYFKIYADLREMLFMAPTMI